MGLCKPVSIGIEIRDEIGRDLGGGVDRREVDDGEGRQADEELAEKHYGWRDHVDGGDAHEVAHEEHETLQGAWRTRGFSLWVGLGVPGVGVTGRGPGRGLMVQVSGFRVSGRWFRVEGLGTGFKWKENSCCLVQIPHWEVFGGRTTAAQAAP